MSEGTGYEALNPAPKTYADDVPYSQDLADRICAQLADGKSMRTVCSADGMPSRTTLFRWMRDIPGFVEQYDKAKAESADALVDDMLADARNESLDPNSRRIRVDTMKWIASKMKPKKYGDKLALTDNDGGPLAIGWAGLEVGRGGT